VQRSVVALTLQKIWAKKAPLRYAFGAKSVAAHRCCLATMKPIQSDTVSANVSDWIDFSVPGMKKCGIGLP
jgi:hypothetical protein